MISKFYYTFEVEDDEVEVVIGIHQEDKRVLGANLRGYLDTNIVILKRDEDDPDELEYYDCSDFQKDREQFKSFRFDAGSYVVVPITSGALLQKIETSKVKKGVTEVDYKNLQIKDIVENSVQIRQYYCNTIYDVFRKIDLAINGILSAKELNQFGRIVGDNKLRSIRQSDFKSEKFKDMSCTAEGLTKFGFVQYLFKNYKPDDIANMLRKLGYDEKLNSLKSRVFVITFQSDEPLRVTINDILEGNMYKTAMNLYLNFLKEEERVEIDDNHDELEIIKYYDSAAKVYLFGVMNNSITR